jgi:branched-chain amino acid transport system permease protein
MRKIKTTTKDVIWWTVLAVFAILPVSGVLPSSYTEHVIILIMLYGSMAQSWNVIGGYCGQTSFGHSVFFGIGAYGAAMAAVTYEVPP